MDPITRKTCGKPLKKDGKTGGLVTITRRNGAKFFLCYGNHELSSHESTGVKLELDTFVRDVATTNVKRAKVVGDEALPLLDALGKDFSTLCSYFSQPQKAYEKAEFLTALKKLMFACTVRVVFGTFPGGDVGIYQLRDISVIASDVDDVGDEEIDLTSANDNCNNSCSSSSSNPNNLDSGQDLEEQQKLIRKVYDLTTTTSTIPEPSPPTDSIIGRQESEKEDGEESGREDGGKEERES
jgi:hypothetical protein